jgi:hypothetical protein
MFFDIYFLTDRSQFFFKLHCIYFSNLSYREFSFEYLYIHQKTEQQIYFNLKKKINQVTKFINNKKLF